MTEDVHSTIRGVMMSRYTREVVNRLRIPHEESEVASHAAVHRISASVDDLKNDLRTLIQKFDHRSHGEEGERKMHLAEKAGNVRRGAAAAQSADSLFDLQEAPITTNTVQLMARGGLGQSSHAGERDMQEAVIEMQEQQALMRSPAHPHQKLTVTPQVDSHATS